MSHLVTIRVPGIPRPKERPRFARNKKTGKVNTYTPAYTRHYEQTVGFFGNRAMAGQEAPFCVPLTVIVYAYMEIPHAAPDADNIMKIVGDALNKIVWIDDAIIVESTVVKLLSSEPRLEIFVSEADHVPSD